MSAALTQLKKWFGASVEKWQFIKRYKIKEELTMGKLSFRWM